MARNNKCATRIRPARQTAQVVLRQRASQPEPAAQPSPRVVAARAERDEKHQASSALFERALRQILAVTYWFEPAECPEPYPVTVRFEGRRLGVEGPPQPGDTFVREEMILEVVPGSGPIALTVRIPDVNPGEWDVKASVLEPAASKRRGQEVTSVRPLGGALPALVRMWWLRWAPPAESGGPLKTRIEPFIHVPGIIPLVWGSLVGVGIVVALVVQALVAAREHLPAGSVTLATLLAIGSGAIGAKVWYIVKHRRTHDFIGWCIQGFIVGATLVAILMFALVVHMPLGNVLDVSAPGLMLGMAVGRVGCFFAGCCSGPATSSRWGVWCSDQHVGARRIPTQLMEMVFCLIVGLATLAAIMTHGLAGGAYFVAAIAAYTFFREGILRLRAEPLTLRLPVPVTAMVSALVLIGAFVVAIVR